MTEPTWAEAVRANPIGGMAQKDVPYPTMTEAKKANLIQLLQWDRRLIKPKDDREARVYDVIHHLLCEKRDKSISDGMRERNEDT